jgi:hypothetical protein
MSDQKRQYIQSRKKVRHANSTTIPSFGKKLLSAYLKAMPMLREQRPASFGSRAARCPSSAGAPECVFNGLGMELCGRTRQSWTVEWTLFPFK